MNTGCLFIILLAFVFFIGMIVYGMPWWAMLVICGLIIMVASLVSDGLSGN